MRIFIRSYLALTFASMALKSMSAVIGSTGAKNRMKVSFMVLVFLTKLIILLRSLKIQISSMIIFCACQNKVIDGYYTNVFVMNPRTILIYVALKIDNKFEFQKNNLSSRIIPPAPAFFLAFNLLKDLEAKRVSMFLTL